MVSYPSQITTRIYFRENGRNTCFNFFLLLKFYIAKNLTFLFVITYLFTALRSTDKTFQLQIHLQIATTFLCVEEFQS